MKILVGARESPLSQVQVKEVLYELQKIHPQISFEPLLVSTLGDKDQKTSLRTLGKTDFFTREIDVMIARGKCRIGIHSAKDLPDPMPSELAVVAVTKGLDSSDSLVFRQGESLDKLPVGAIVATSSERREAVVRELRKDLCFVDLRGTIHQRLAKLDSREVDGVVVAEAALIRLNLTNLSRLRLPGQTVPYQGQLAIVARIEDREMHQIFSAIDVRRK